MEMDFKIAGLDAPSKAAAAGQKLPMEDEEEALIDALPELRARLDAL